MIKSGDEPIPGYRVEELLGQGQFGQVWRARSPGNMSLALKFLSLTGRHGWKEFRAIQRVKQIRHAHLMPIVAIWLLDEQGTIISDDAIEGLAASHQDLDSGSPATKTLVVDPIRDTRRPAQLIVATLVANQTLGDRLKECRREGQFGIPVDELLGYMSEAAKGLDFLNSSQHKIGDSLGAVQHCDVKPDNIMLSGGSVVICDFGVAQVLAKANADANATSLGGTPAYMAPECFKSKPSPTTDQYSLAVTYYELRTGQLPFNDQTFAAVYAAHQNGRLDFSAVNSAEQEVLRRATTTESEKRFQSCADLADKLREAVYPPTEKPTRRRAWVVAAGIAVAAAVGLASIDWMEREDAPLFAPARIVLVVDPPDALVSVDGKTVVLDKTGRTAFDGRIGWPVEVIASKAPERLEMRLKIEPVEGDLEKTITLAYSASYFAKEADKLLSAGKFDQAVAALTQAIKLDADVYVVMPQPILLPTDETAVKCLDISASGRWLACGSDSGAVRRWSIEPDRIGDSDELVHQHSDEVSRLAITDSSTASISKNAHEISLSRVGRETITLAIPDDQAEFKSLVIAGSGRWLVAASEVWDFSPLRGTTTLHAWDIEADDVPAAHRELLKEDELDPILAPAHEEAWVVLATSPNSDAGSDARSGAVVRQCWIDVEKQRTIHQQRSDVRAIAVSQDDRWIAVGGGRTSNAGETDGADYRSTVIDAQGDLTQELRWGHFDQIVSLAFDASGEHLATGGRDGDAQVWRIAANWNPSQELGEKPVFLTQHGGQAAVRSVVCPRSGWVACGYEEKAALWYSNAENPTPLWISDKGARVTAIASTPDGKWLITGHRDGTIRLWPTERLMLIDRACAAAGEKPRERKPDKLTRSDRSSSKVRRCLWEHVRIACDPVIRPTGAFA